MDLAAVRAKLRKERKARDWSLDDLAEKSGVNRSTIHEIETSAIGKPQLETVGRLIEGMGLTISDFFAQIEGLPPTRQTDPQSAIQSSKADPDAPTLSAAERSADAVVQRALIAAIAQEIAGAIDRLIESRTADRPFEKAEAAARRRAGADH